MHFSIQLADTILAFAKNSKEDQLLDNKSLTYSLTAKLNIYSGQYETLKKMVLKIILK